MRNNRLPIRRQEQQTDYLYSKGVTNNERYLQEYLGDRTGPPQYKSTTFTIPISASEPFAVLSANPSRKGLIIQNIGSVDLYLCWDGIPQYTPTVQNAIKLVSDAVLGERDNGIVPTVSTLFAIADTSQGLLSITELTQLR